MRLPDFPDWTGPFSGVEWNRTWDSFAFYALWLPASLPFLAVFAVALVMASPFIVLWWLAARYLRAMRSDGSKW